MYYGDFGYTCSACTSDNDIRIEERWSYIPFCGSCVERVPQRGNNGNSLQAHVDDDDYGAPAIPAYAGAHAALLI